MNKKYSLKDLCEISSSSNDNYVGIKFLEDEIKVYFPLGYQLPSNDADCRKSIIHLLKVLSIENKIKKSDSNYSINNDEKDEIPLYSFLWIINDYLNNGLYNDREKIYVKGNSGKINWKKTLNQKFYISKNVPIYLDLFVEKNTLEDNIITDIHAFCVKVSVDYIGWLFGNIPIPIHHVNMDKKNYYLSLVHREMIHSFDDRKKSLLFNIEKILKMSGGNVKSKIKDYGTYDFEYIWEYMVNSVYGNLDPKKFFPNSIYVLKDFKDEVEASKLRPDTVLEVGKDLYILDSKYYKYGITKNTKDLPETDSTQKQITYADQAKNKYPQYHNIFNAFILPFNKDEKLFNTDRCIQYVGYSKSSWRKNINYYEHISLVLMDTKFLIECYVNHENSEIDKLLASIQEVMDDFNS